MYVYLTVGAYREGNLWVSYCQELGTASQGRTRKEALGNILEATELYLNTLEDLGECRQVLEEKGVTIHQEPTPVPRAPSHGRGRRGAVPTVFPLSAACSA